MNIKELVEEIKNSKWFEYATEVNIKYHKPIIISKHNGLIVVNTTKDRPNDPNQTRQANLDYLSEMFKDDNSVIVPAF